MTDTILLLITLLLPLTGGLWMFTLPAGHRVWSLVITLVVFGCSLGVLAAFDFGPEAPAFQLQAAMPWVDAFGLRFSWGLDAISLWLVLLTTFLMPLVVLGSFSAVEQRPREFFGWLLILQTAMIGTFIARDLVFFYICFEFTLIPLYFLIGVFGSKNRLKAARVFFLYTFTGSMLTLAGLLYVAWWSATYVTNGQWTFDIAQLTVSAQAMSLSQQTWVFAALLAGFAVKVPLFPVHTWLPLAHTEAPTAGSVILAGVLLKLGTYGMLRFALPMTPLAAIEYAPLIGAFAVVGILYTALICWVQTDIKKLIAYSSVSHLGFCVLGMFALNLTGANGSVMYMINHGLSTGALFLCVGMIYERFHTREFALMGGLGRVMPVWTTFFVFFALASVGLPGLNGFVGEFLTLMGAFAATRVLGPWYAAVAGVGMIFGAIYILYMVGRVCFGPLRVPAVHGGEAAAPSHVHTGDDHDHSHAGHKPRDLNPREIITLLPLAAGCLVLGLYPTPVLKSLEPAVTAMIQPANDRLNPPAVPPAYLADEAADQVTIGLIPNSLVDDRVFEGQEDGR